MEYLYIDEAIYSNIPYMVIRYIGGKDGVNMTSSILHLSVSVDSLILVFNGHRFESNPPIINTSESLVPTATWE